LAVRVLGTLETEARNQLLAGVEIDGQRASFQTIEEGGGEGLNKWYRVTIAEGRNREVRKLFDTVGLTVSRLIRIRYGIVVLPKGLKRGVWMDLPEGDVRALQRMVGQEGGGRSRDDGRQGRQPRANGRSQGERLDRGDRPDRQVQGVGPRDGDARGDRHDGGSNKRGKNGRKRGGAGPVQGGQRDGRPPRDGMSSGASAGAAVGGDRRGGRQRPGRERGEGGRGDGGAIPNPLQQTYDKRAIREARQPRREYGDDGPIPNPLQQTFDQRALKESNRQPRREYGDDGPIPNPLQQTFDKRLMHNNPNGLDMGRRGGQRGPRGFGGGGSDNHQPDPMQTAVGYIGADAFRAKQGGRGGRGGGGRQGGGRRGGR
jgi:23S rRNA pseudouridine2605 synthase